MKEKQSFKNKLETKHGMYGPRILEGYKNDSEVNKESEFDDTALENLDKVDQLDDPSNLLLNKTISRKKSAFKPA